MSRARRYPVAGDPGPIPADKVGRPVIAEQVPHPADDSEFFVRVTATREEWIEIFRYESATTTRTITARLEEQGVELP